MALKLCGATCYQPESDGVEFTEVVALSRSTNESTPTFMFSEPVKDDYQEVLSRYGRGCLQGNWYRKNDGALVGTVCGEFLEVQNVGWTPKASIFLIPEGTTDTLILSPDDGQTFFGIICLDAQHSISWNNGEIWLKK